MGDLAATSSIAVVAGARLGVTESRSILVTMV